MAKSTRVNLAKIQEATSASDEKCILKTLQESHLEIEVTLSTFSSQVSQEQPSNQRSAGERQQKLPYNIAVLTSNVTPERGHMESTRVLISTVLVISCYKCPCTKEVPPLNTIL